jgi:hypothetical protein
MKKILILLILLTMVKVDLLAPNLDLSVQGGWLDQEFYKDVPNWWALPYETREAFKKYTYLDDRRGRYTLRPK